MEHCQVHTVTDLQEREHPGDPQLAQKRQPGDPRPAPEQDTLHLQGHTPPRAPHCPQLALTSLLEKKPQTEPKVPLCSPTSPPPGWLIPAMGCRGGPPTPGSTGGGAGGSGGGQRPVAMGAPPRTHGPTLFGWCPRGWGCPLCTHRLGRGPGGCYGFWGGTHSSHPTPPIVGAGCVGGHARVWPGAQKGWVHPHAGTRVCTRVHAGMRVFKGCCCTYTPCA